MPFVSTSLVGLMMIYDEINNQYFDSFLVRLGNVTRSHCL